MLLIGLFIFFYVFFSHSEQGEAMRWDALESAVEKDQVSRVIVHAEGGEGVGTVVMRDGKERRTFRRPLKDFTGLSGVAVVFSEASSYQGILPFAVPLGVCFVVFIFFLWRLPRQSTLLQFNPQPERVATAAPLPGLEEVRRQLLAAAQALKAGTDGARRILIQGPAGSGKTSLLRAVAADSGLPLLALPASQFVEIFVGQGAARIRKVFEIAAAAAPCVLAIDDVDAFAVRRLAPQPAQPGIDERGTTLLELCNRLEGLNPFPKKVLFLATTSRPDLLDEALTRPGRFDLHLSLEAAGPR